MLHFSLGKLQVRVIPLTLMRRNIRARLGLFSLHYWGIKFTPRATKAPRDNDIISSIIHLREMSGNKRKNKTSDCEKFTSPRVERVKTQRQPFGDMMIFSPCEMSMKIFWRPFDPVVLCDFLYGLDIWTAKANVWLSKYTVQKPILLDSVVIRL